MMVSRSVFEVEFPISLLPNQYEARERKTPMKNIHRRAAATAMLYACNFAYYFFNFSRYTITREMTTKQADAETKGKVKDIRGSTA